MLWVSREQSVHVQVERGGLAMGGEVRGLEVICEENVVLCVCGGCQCAHCMQDGSPCICCVIGAGMQGMHREWGETNKSAQ